MARQPEHLEFRDDDRQAVVARMTGLATDRSGWINLSPEVDDDHHPDVEPVGGLAGWLGGPRNIVPLATWAPGARTGKGLEPISVGIAHGTSRRVVGWLAEMGSPVPDGWTVVQDHPRRGLVLQVPEHTQHGAVLGWLLHAVDLLCPHPLTGHWLAAVHIRRRAAGRTAT